MKIIGSVNLVFRDKDTGEITKQITEKNTITNFWLETYLCSNGSELFGPEVILSEHIPFTDTGDPNVKVGSRIHPYGFGVDPAFVAYEATATDFAYGEYHHRFSAPPADITINTIGLTDDNAVDSDRVITPLQTMVKLSVPCIQTTSETLDVYYRITVPHDYYLEPSPVDIDSSGISGAMAYQIVRRICQNSQSEWVNNVIPNWNGNVNHTRLAHTSAENGSYDSTTPLSGTVSISAKTDVHKMDVHTNVTIDKGIGALVGYLAYGGGTITPWARKVTGPNDGVIQGIFGHAAAATVPFHDTPTQATGDGTISLDGSGWTNPDFPKMYRLDITGSGGVGVGTYQYRVRNHFGFVGNTYKDAHRTCSSFASLNKHMFDNFQFMPDDLSGDASEDLDHPTWMPYITFGDAIAVNKDAICVVNIPLETGTVFNSTLFPTFTPTNITQVTFEPGGTIYVGCRDSGIYKITNPTTSPTVTKIDSSTTGLGSLAGSPAQTKCYGVSYGNSRLWAMFDGGLFSSTDSGVSWSQANFFNPTITVGGSPANNSWDLVKYIKADKTHADQRLAIIYDSGGTTHMEMGVIWWDEASSLGSPAADTSIQGPTPFISWNRTAISAVLQYQRVLVDEPWTYFMMFEPSPTGNKWGANTSSSATPTTQASTLYPAYFTFGETGKVQTVNTYLQNYQTYCSWEYDSSGDENICVVSIPTTYYAAFSLYKDDTSITSSTFRNANDALQGNRTAPGYGALMYLGKMVHFFWRAQLTYGGWYGITTMNEVNSVEGLADFQHLLYDKYGWNGAAWELDHAGSKTIHLSYDTLEDGITIAFNQVGSPPGSFNATDYYTFGVNKGVWLDGSTTIDHYTGVFFKKYVTGQTGLESGTLSGSTRVPDIFEISPPSGSSFTWQDTNNVTTTNDDVRTTATTSLYDAGARSNESISGNVGFTNKAGKDVVHGKMITGTYNGILNLGEAISIGLSSSAVLGNAINKDTIEYGFEIVALGAGVGNGYNCDVYALEGSGSPPIATNVLRIDTLTHAGYFYEIEILNDGTVNWYVWNDGSTTTIDYADGTVATDERVKVHTTSGAPIVDYYIDVALNAPVTTRGFDFNYSNAPTSIQDRRGNDGTPQPRKRFCQRVAADYFHIFGDFGSSNGRYLPNFFAVDSTQGLEVLIDGVKAQLIADNDLTTTLLAGEISVFPREGCFRYSASDVGKTVTATYNCVTTE